MYDVWIIINNFCGSIVFPEGIEMTGSFCPKCGSQKKPGAKFCGVCGQPFPDTRGGKDIAATAKRTADTISSVTRSVETTISTAKSVAGTAEQISQFVITPPARWKVVIGDRLPDMGEAMVDKTAGMAQAKVQEVVTNQVQQVVEKTVTSAIETATRRESVPPVPAPEVGGRAADPPPKTILQPVPAAGQVSRCPACGSEMRSGAKFCGKCGAKTFPAASTSLPSHTCPSCGSELKTGAKFCGRCGAKIG